MKFPYTYYSSPVHILCNPTHLIYISSVKVLEQIKYDFCFIVFFITCYYYDQNILFYAPYRSE